MNFSGVLFATRGANNIKIKHNVAAIANEIILTTISIEPNIVATIKITTNDASL